MGKYILPLLLFGLSRLLIAQDSTKINKFSLEDPKPNGIPKVFRQDMISLKESNEHTCSFSPDGLNIFFTRDSDRKTLVTRKFNNKWSQPIPADFNGREAIFSPDGTKLYFGDGDIWFIEKKNDGWTKPQKLPSSINTDSYEYYASSSNNENIYFSRLKDNHAILLVSKFENSHYLEATELPSPINEDSSNNYHPFISPKEDFIIFNSERTGGYGGADLYISYRDLQGNWKKPINLGNKINSELRDICPTITPDGKYLFFTRNWQENGKWYGDIYWIETSFIE